MSPRQYRLGNPQSFDAPHVFGLRLQIGLHVRVVASEPADHVQPVRAVEWQVGETNLLDPFGQPPGPFVAAHESGTAVPFAGHCAAIDACQRVEMHVVGRAQPIGQPIGTLDAQERLVPPVLPPLFVFGLPLFTGQWPVPLAVQRGPWPADRPGA